jgi:uncharacterized damage-inducible protein DinB
MAQAKDGVIESLLSFMDEAFERGSWHGPNLRGALRGVSAAGAAWRPAPGRHSIWELAIHCAYWKYAVWRRLTGTKRGSFPREGSNWFAAPEPATEQAWRQDLVLLGQWHRRLRAEVAGLNAAALGRKSRGSRQTNGRLVRGIAAHDLYHAGQVQLLKRLAPAAALRPEAL